MENYINIDLSSPVKTISPIDFLKIIDRKELIVLNHIKVEANHSELSNNMFSAPVTIQVIMPPALSFWQRLKWLFTGNIS